MELSPIRKFVPYADAARAAGKKVYGLNIGQPDIKTPRAFFDAVKNFDQDVLAYANSQGIGAAGALVGYYKRLGLSFEKKEPAGHDRRLRSDFHADDRIAGRR